MVDRSPTTADRERADLLLQLLSQRLEVRKLRVKDAKKRESWVFRSFVERNRACVAAAVVAFGHIKGTFPWQRPRTHCSRRGRG